MSDRALILGVGHAQVDAIEVCSRMGLEVHALSYSSYGPGIPLADCFEQINILDKVAVLEYAKRINPKFVYSVGSDVAMPTVAFVSNQLSLPVFFNELIAELLQHKGRLRGFLAEHHLSPIPFQVADSLDALEQWKVFPAILKPVDSQGQRGVIRVNDRKQIHEQFRRTVQFSRAGQVIVEAYIEGSEISVNAYVEEGNVTCLVITDRYVVNGVPGGIVRGHRLPANIPEHIATQTDQLARQVIAMLGLRNGPVYFQLKYTGDQVYVIEVAPRLDGCHIWRLINQGYEVDLLQRCFDHLLGCALTPLPKHLDLHDSQPVELAFFLQQPDSLFDPELHHHHHHHAVQFWEHWYYTKGERVRVINGFSEKVGYQIYSAPPLGEVPNST